MFVVHSPCKSNLSGLDCVPRTRYGLIAVMSGVRTGRRVRQRCRVLEIVSCRGVGRDPKFVIGMPGHLRGHGATPSLPFCHCGQKIISCERLVRRHVSKSLPSPSERRLVLRILDLEDVTHVHYQFPVVDCRILLDCFAPESQSESHAGLCTP